MGFSVTHGALEALSFEHLLGWLDQLTREYEYTDEQQSMGTELDAN